MICGNVQIMTFLFDSVDKQMTYFCQLGLVLGSVPGKPGQLLTSVHLHTSRGLACSHVKQKISNMDIAQKISSEEGPNQPLPQLVPCWLMS